MRIPPLSTLTLLFCCSGQNTRLNRYDTQCGPCCDKPISCNQSNLTPPGSAATTLALGDKTPARDVSTYADRMRESQLDRERDNTMRQIAQKKREEAEAAASDQRLAVGWWYKLSAVAP
jgi:hypothetical protein